MFLYTTLGIDGQQQLVVVLCEDISTVWWQQTQHSETTINQPPKRVVECLVQDFSSNAQRVSTAGALNGVCAWVAVRLSSNTISDGMERKLRLQGPCRLGSKFEVAESPGIKNVHQKMSITNDFCIPL